MNELFVPVCNNACVCRKMKRGAGNKSWIWPLASFTGASLAKSTRLGVLSLLAAEMFS